MRPTLIDNSQIRGRITAFLAYLSDLVLNVLQVLGVVLERVRFIVVGVLAGIREALAEPSHLMPRRRFPLQGLLNFFLLYLWNGIRLLRILPLLAVDRLDLEQRWIQL
mmetsp:Transcript_33229/g.50938  ORF Transcript_33229/g.50938 Transcript_33229/m.50938 type:complete len:108 (-) Transcript_33229:747-1070(-)